MRARLEIQVDASGNVDATKLVPLLAGPGGAIAALLLFIGYLLKELASSRGEREKYMSKYEQMREERDMFRYVAGDAVRAGKRSIQTTAALSRERIHHVDDTEQGEEK